MNVELILAAERAAEADFDKAQARWHADRSESNRAAYEAATWAFEAAVRRVIAAKEQQT